MKKIIITILSLAIVLSFSACGDKEETQKKTDQTKAQKETQSLSEKENVVENTPDSKEAISASDAEPETAVNAPAQEQQIPSVDASTTEQQTQSVQASEPEKAPVQQAPANAGESEEPAQVVSPFAADPSEFKPTESQVEKDSSNWEQFLKEYDKWADEYIAATNKFMSNPNDVSAAADFQAKLHEFNSWSARASEVQMELTSASEKNREKYQKELTRITTKLSQAMPQAAQG